MTDENGDNLDPITKMSVEIDNLKKRFEESEKQKIAKDKQLNDMMNANKRLVAELAAAKDASMTSPQKRNSGEVAYSAFKKTLVGKE